MVGSLIGTARVSAPGISPTDNYERFGALENRIEALELACAGMWDLLKAKHGYSDEEIVDHIHAVDLRDGKLDGKFSPVDSVCPHCGKKLLTRSRKRCVWCGAELKMSPF